MFRRLLALYDKSGRYEEGRRLCEIAAKRWPTQQHANWMMVPSRFVSALSRKLADGEELRINQEGQALERAGRVAEAIVRYEYGVANETRSPFTYERLLILYRRERRFEDELPL
jgi:hypothetical protein